MKTRKKEKMDLYNYTCSAWRLKQKQHETTCNPLTLLQEVDPSPQFIQWYTCFVSAAWSLGFSAMTTSKTDACRCRYRTTKDRRLKTRSNPWSISEYSEDRSMQHAVGELCDNVVEHHFHVFLKEGRRTTC